MKNQKSITVGVIVSVLVLLSACAVQHVPNGSQEQWAPVPGGQAGETAIFVDAKSIRHVSDTVIRLRIRYKYSTPKPFDSGYIEELTVNNEYDCNNKVTYRILGSEAYFTDGKSKTDSSERRGYILPDDAVFHYVCR
jgi:hypothetical protein